MPRAGSALSVAAQNRTSASRSTPHRISRNGPIFGQIVQQRQIGIHVARQEQDSDADQQQRRDNRGRFMSLPYDSCRAPERSASLNRPNTISSTGQVRPKLTVPN